MGQRHIAKASADVYCDPMVLCRQTAWCAAVHISHTQLHPEDGEEKDVEEEKEDSCEGVWGLSV